MISIYTCGSMSMAHGGNGGRWRADLPEIEGVEWVHPRIAPNGDAGNAFRPDLYTPRDYHVLKRCDGVLVVFEPGAVDRQIGTCVEVGLAKAWDMPIVAVVPDLECHEVFGFAWRMANHVESDIESGVEALLYFFDLSGTEWI